MVWRGHVTTFLTIFLFHFVEESSMQSRYIDRWEKVSIRYGYWYELPPYQSTAFKEGYRRINDVCKTALHNGFLFEKDGNTKTMPIYDFNGNLAGIQSSIPGNMKGFNSLNQSIDLPPLEIMPPLLKGTRDHKGMIYYIITAYFKHPKLICSPIATADVSPGKGLYIQTGFDLENDFLRIPLESKFLSSMWKKGPCLPLMGVHYFMNLDYDLPCEKLYPVFLTYDIEGKLGAFGWVFQGRPHNFYSNDGLGHWFHLTPITYPFIFDTSMLPSCMMNSKFQVFGIHVFLRDHKEMVCTKNVDKSHQTLRPSEMTPITQIPSQRTIINADYISNSNTINDHSDNGSSFHMTLGQWTYIVCLVYLCLCSLLLKRMP
ncbi:hypothetical protein CHS0354_011546 [Potamilus streckersoni]|uniref:Uncharacterized protein n=1 Tax=Potamilus streckersoni TaxID=2493646 RepID=A0AAE0SL87_9BIVA|nr:hypothetical protein CHS0354_011546 [Potamilus streckersoni]